MRIAIVCLIAVSIFAASSASASAHGVAPKGTLLKKNVSISQTTGNCACVWRWFTIAAEPGTLKLTARIERVGHVSVGSYGIQMYLFQGNKTLKMGQIGCLPKHKCSDVARLTYRATKPAIDYVRVSAPGVISLSFKLEATGSVGRLRCGHYC